MFLEIGFNLFLFFLLVLFDDVRLQFTSRTLTNYKFRKASFGFNLFLKVAGVKEFT